MSKRLVHYIASKHDQINVGRSAYLHYGPIDHDSPMVSNDSSILTSPVISHDPVTGNFETANTRYVACESA